MTEHEYGLLRTYRENVYRQKQWDDRFIGLARHIATWSRDPSTKVGCVIVSPDHNGRALGYNGFPRGIADNERLSDRSVKQLLVVHAEANAISAAARAGTPLHGCTAYVTAPPCSQCAALLIQVGIVRIVYAAVEMRPEWAKSLEAAKSMCEEAGVDHVEHKETDDA